MKEKQMYTPIPCTRNPLALYSQEKITGSKVGEFLA